MNYTPDYTISLPDGGVPLLFNSWAFRKYSQTIGVELEALLQSVGTGQAFKSSNLPTLLLIAAESYCKFNNKEFTYSDLDACIWVDHLGGFNSTKLVDIYKYFVCKLLNISPEGFDVLWNKATAVEEEKREIKKKKQKQNSHGTSSM